MRISMILLGFFNLVFMNNVFLTRLVFRCKIYDILRVSVENKFHSGDFFNQK